MTYQKILHYVQSQGFFSEHGNVLIAVSGGVDSMNLLHFLHIHQKELGIVIAIAHINHKQRPESDNEEAYLKKWAFDHQVAFYSQSFTGKFSEKTARDFRYAFFKRIMEEQNIRALVTAHHAEDQAETVFLRLLRGARLRHLGGMKEVQSFGKGELIRPFLTFDKSQLPPVFHFEDDSNQETTFLRNRIRNTYFPQLKEENPQFSKQLLSLGKEIDFLLEAFQQLTANLDCQDCQVFHSQKPAVQYFLLQDYLSQFSDLNLSKAQFEEVLHILRTKDHYNHLLKNGYYITKTKERFTISKISPETDSHENEKMLEYGNIVSFGQYRFSFRDQDSQGIPLFSQSPLLLRHRRPGDRIQLGNYSKKLRRLFIDDKIPPQERQNALIAEQDGEIVAICLSGRTYLRKEFKDGIMKGKLCIQKVKEG